jgi:hypothetical protein
MHSEGISAKGGLVKPFSFYQLIAKLMRDHYELTYAMKDDIIIAGLLIFKFKDTIEYHTPALFLEFATEQGTSLLIFEAMKRAVRNKYWYWNFGGIWETQTSLYMFKKSWGADDVPYYYYVSQYDDIDKILELEPREIIEEFKWFYVMPFNQLEKVKL